MEELTALLIVFGVAFGVFVLALPVLAGLNGSCAERCDAFSEPQCDLCPRRPIEDVTDGSDR